MTPNELRHTIRTNIRARRLELGLTQRALASAVGVKQPTIAQFEKGIATPTLETVALLAEAMNVSPDLLFRPGMFTEKREPAVH